MLRKTRLSWLGHIARMADERTVKRLLFGQIDGPRPVGGSLTTLRRTFKADVLALQGGVPNGVALHDAAQDRARWRDMVARATWDNREAAAAATGGNGGAPTLGDTRNCDQELPSNLLLDPSSISSGVLCGS
jgi:hypothetical protein